MFVDSIAEILDLYGNTWNTGTSNKNSRKWWYWGW